jgi:hypothetical protein
MVMRKDCHMRVDQKRSEALARQRSVSRRQFLQIGGFGSLGLTLPTLLRAEEDRASRGSADGHAVTSPIRSCILIFYYGGPSHIDTYDMKPNAPAEVRGPFGSIASSVPGLRICEHMPLTAPVMDRVAIIRSMHRVLRNHAPKRRVFGNPEKMTERFI